MEKPRQSSPSAQDGMMSPSVLWSTRAPTSLLTSPSLKGTTEVEVSIERLLDRPRGISESETRVSAQEPPQFGSGCTAPQLLPSTCPGTSRKLPLVVIQWSGASQETEILVLCNG